MAFLFDNNQITEEALEDSEKEISIVEKEILHAESDPMTDPKL